MDARQRTILSVERGEPPGSHRIVCAEPSPDALATIAASAGVSGGISGIIPRASLLAVEEQDKARFFVAMQDNFVRIFPSENVTADEVFASMNAVLAEDAVLSRYAVT